MQLSTANDVKIYNLSAGKSLPEWVTSEKRRKLEQKNVDIRRRIQLIQDFDMPDVSNTVTISPDGRYVFATGSYKPFLKCFDLNDLSLKFQRGLDADVIKMVCLSDDYTKFVLLEEERYVEMHAGFGRYFRLRIPRFGRDMAYSKESADLYIVGSSNEIFRLNLEQGEFLQPLETGGASNNCCEFNDYHQLFVCGSNDGRVEAWDHRDRTRVGILDVAPHLETGNVPEITAVHFRDALHFGVGTQSGHTVLYDIRSSRPLLVKDHNMGLPITKLSFVRREEGDVVLSMDSRCLKMWHEQTGKPFAAIETDAPLTDFVRYPDSGLLFFANEQPRMQQFFVPQLGTAPKWCSYLETITEELEETTLPEVYDDYKFVTAEQLEQIGLSHLVGTNVLRAYMHGYFMDARLYAKAHTLTQPFALDKYKERKIQEKLEAEREASAVAARKKAKKALPAVNRDLAAKLRELEHATDALSTGQKKKEKKRAALATTILSDDRFSKLFKDGDFEVDEMSEAYALKYANQAPLTKKAKDLGDSEGEENEDGEGEGEGDESGIEEDEDIVPQTEYGMDDKGGADSGESDLSDGEGSDSDSEVVQEKISEREQMRRLAEAREKRQQKREAKEAEEEAEREMRLADKPNRFVLHAIGSGEDTKKYMDETYGDEDEAEAPLAARRSKLEKSGATLEVEAAPFGGRQISFQLKSQTQKRQEERASKQEQHIQERKESRRTTRDINHTLKRIPVGSRGGRGGGRGGRGGGRGGGRR